MESRFGSGNASGIRAAGEKPWSGSPSGMAVVPAGTGASRREAEPAAWWSSEWAVGMRGAILKSVGWGFACRSFCFSSHL